MVLKEDQRIRMTKKLLKESLLKMLQTENIHKISIRALCDTSGINRSTFYKYYGSHHDLLRDMENDLLTQIEQYINNIAIDVNDHLGLIGTLTFLQENLDLCKILINSDVSPEFPKKLLHLPSIQQKVDEIIPDVENSDTILYAYECIVYGGYYMLKSWINNENRETPEEMAQAIKHMFHKLLK